jgi:hypothetical protein
MAPIRYRYHPIQPPAPFVNVTLRHPTGTPEHRDVPAQIDSGADRSVFPEDLIRLMGLPQVGQLTIGGLGGLQHTMPLFAVLLGVHDLPAEPLEVIGSRGEPWILLGRDVLNAHRLLLDGPQLALEIG